MLSEVPAILPMMMRVLNGGRTVASASRLYMMLSEAHVPQLRGDGIDTDLEGTHSGAHDGEDYTRSLVG
jgi:hypothetical protein